MFRKHLWSKAFEYGLDEVDVKLLNIIANNLGFLNSDYESLSNKTGLPANEVKKRIQTLRGKKIILKDRISLIDMPKVWDLYLFTFVKTKIETPVEGLKIKTPIGWIGIMDTLINSSKKFGTNMIRQAFALYGSEWDILLLKTVNDQSDDEEFFDFLAEEGWVRAASTARPSEIMSYIFDPIAVPSLEEYKEMVETPLQKKGRVWKKAILNELDESDIRILNVLAEDSGFSSEDYNIIAKISGESGENVRKRIKTLESKGIIRKERISSLDVFKLWDFYFLTLIKTNEPKKIFSEIEKRNKDVGIVRQAFVTWGGGDWNIMLFITVNRISDLENFLAPILSKYPAERMYLIKQQDRPKGIYDPVAVPTLDEYKEEVEGVLRDYK